jgi:arylsulfatase A-like enzyme
VSLVPYLFHGEPPPERDLFWRLRGQGALRRGGWKYVFTPGEDSPVDQLYHLATDMREQANLATRQPDRLAELKTSWETTNRQLLPYT